MKHTGASSTDSWMHRKAHRSRADERRGANSLEKAGVRRERAASDFMASLTRDGDDDEPDIYITALNAGLVGSGCIRVQRRSEARSERQPSLEFSNGPQSLIRGRERRLSATVFDRSER